MSETTTKFQLGPRQTEWLEALKSGKYKHGKGKLCKIIAHREFHCCLGVLCEISGVPKRITEGGIVAAFGDSTFSIEDSLAKALGFKIITHCRMPDDTRGLLADKNDEESTADFDPIIKMMEKTPELIFAEPK